VRARAASPHRQDRDETTLTDRLLYPSIVGAFLGLTWWLLALMPARYAELVPGLLSLPTMLFLAWLERRRPARTEWRTNRGDRTADLLHTFILFPLVLKLAQTSAALLSGRWFGFQGFQLFPSATPLWAELVAVLLLGELIFYGVHRLAHALPFLWAFHRIHHGAERVYYANAGRFHPVDLWLTMTLYFLPFYAVALHTHVLVLFVAANVVTGLLEHANIRFAAGPLNLFMNTAELHRWHHSRRLEEANRNFGKVLCVWDHVFGTWLGGGPAVADVAQVLDVGLGAGEAPVPPTIRAQAVLPFTRKPS
jgi:sterol desaturase/sphingolipid hydroxylase (fatty acid hydroxylase superfamily)